MPKMTRSRNEFPLLQSMGLRVCPIRGDGNCLFNALSDQIYGDQTKHAEIRKAVIQYMRDNPHEFKPFLTVGATQRRNPKRKNAGGFSSTFAFTKATEEETDAAYEAHLMQMAQGGTWGDNIEIQAFAHAYNTDVKIYHANYAYYVKAAPNDIARPVAHIAHHTWEHYSSIRNIDGPMTGLPHIQATLPTPQDAASEATGLKHTNVDPWKIKAVIGFLPHLIDEAAITKALEHNGGNINNAVSMLLEAEYISSQSSTPASQSTAGSSSIERDSDSDDEEIYRPSKRQNRTIKAEISLVKGNDVSQMQETRSSDTLGTSLGVHSDEEVIQGPNNGKIRSMKTRDTFPKHDHKKRIIQMEATYASDATSSESELESELKSRRPRSSKSSIEQTTFNSKREKGENGSGEPDPPTDSEADDEYQPGGEDDADSDFIPNARVSAFHGSSLHDEQKNILHTKLAQKLARKDGRRTRPSDKLLGRTIETFNHTRIPSPIEKVVGMKVLFI